ncbi:MAG TPA: hypothetical protein VFS08_04030 [Gemmatimonadaceae bacterium]|nr:hypothetical protein [Gemmatimonadaceae bacterium]
MPTPTPIVCEHDLRPGVTICLHCRHKERLAAAARRRRFALRYGSVALAVGVVAAVAVPRLQRAEARRPPAAAAPAPVVRTAAMRLADAPAALAAPGAPAAAAAPAPPAGPAPIVAEGRTELHDGIVAVRTGDTVAVHFDTPLTRTRRPWKFERIVRATLPEVFGTAADSALAATPAGGIAQAGDLLTELPVRGVRLRTSDGDTLALWPETRPGRDGPLVVTYRVAVVR